MLCCVQRSLGPFGIPLTVRLHFELVAPAAPRRSSCSTPPTLVVCVCAAVRVSEYSPLDAEVVHGLREWSQQHISRWTNAHSDATGASVPLLPASSISSFSGFVVAPAVSSRAAQFQRQLSSLREAEWMDLTCRVLAVNEDRRQLLVWDGTDVQGGVPITWSVDHQPLTPYCGCCGLLSLTYCS